jgi:hypothetical protein
MKHRDEGADNGFEQIRRMKPNAYTDGEKKLGYEIRDHRCCIELAKTP